jgi:hypothetical protein
VRRAPDFDRPLAWRSQPLLRGGRRRPRTSESRAATDVEEPSAVVRPGPAPSPPLWLRQGAARHHHRSSPPANLRRCESPTTLPPTTSSPGGVLTPRPSPSPMLHSNAFDFAYALCLAGCIVCWRGFWSCIVARGLPMLDLVLYIPRV